MELNFNKSGGIIPVIIQDQFSLQVLMLGYMNEPAYLKTIDEGIVTFYSRSKERLWTKGETSGNFLHVKKIEIDCDNDTILIMVKADGPTCHRNTTACFNNDSNKSFLYELEEIINQKIANNEVSSYTNQLYKRGINKVAQKVGEEAVELVIEAKDNDVNLFKNEAADLLYHLLILLKIKHVKLSNVEDVLISRHQIMKS